MKKTPFLIVLIITFAIELSLGLFWTGKFENPKQDTVLINECLYSITDNFGQEDKYSDALEYSIIDNDGSVIFKNSEFVSLSINEAVQKNDTILDVTVNNETVGKMIIRNESIDRIHIYKNRLTVMLIVVSAVQLILIFGYFIYLKRTVTDPFKKLNGFAIRIAEGNLDIPLERDKQNIFGDFTGAFDIMRTELKKARAAEKKAYDDKNEMVAQLSHDIRTPVASIKSASEIGYEITKEEKAKELFNQVNYKADQIATLVDNLFNSSVNDVTKIEVNPYEYNSSVLEELILNSDYLKRAGKITVPKCRIFADKLRLQQVFDNIFMNSYKYAGTDISVRFALEEEYLIVSVRDFGSGVGENELPLLKTKYKRGSNVEGKDGAGLGLYLTDYFLNEMDGKLHLENADPGFTAKVYLRVI